jgi:hypothetical protein
MLSRQCCAVAARLLCALLGGLQAGCVQTQPGALPAYMIEEEKRALERYETEKVKYEPLVGKTLWVTASMHLRLCTVPTLIPTECKSIEPRERFVVDRLAPGSYGSGLNKTTESEPYCHVTTSDDRSGYVNCYELEEDSTDIDQAVAAADCKRHGGRPRIGMSIKLVVACWGKPSTIRRRETARGISESYIYNRERSVLFHNGAAVTIRTEPD